MKIQSCLFSTSLAEPMTSKSFEAILIMVVSLSTAVVGAPFPGPKPATGANEIDGVIHEMQVLGLHKEPFSFSVRYGYNYNPGPTAYSKVKIESAAKTSYYYLGKTKVGWSEAMEDCKQFFGNETTTLLNINTKHEYDMLKILLATEDDEHGSEYWIGGKYDTEKSTFTWDNSVPFQYWVPWDEEVGEPVIKSSLARTYMYEEETNGHRELRVRTDVDTVPRRYICEIMIYAPDEAVPCPFHSDLIFVLDSSSNVGHDNFSFLLDFSLRLTSAFKEYVNGDTRIGIVLLGGNGTVSVIDLQDGLKLSEATGKIGETPYLGGDNDNHAPKALSIAENLFQKKNDGWIPKNLIFVAASGENVTEELVKAGKRLDEAGVNTVAIGIGPNVTKEALEAVAGGKSDRVYQVREFEEILLFLLGPVSKQICDVMNMTLPPTTPEPGIRPFTAKPFPPGFRLPPLN